MKELIMSVLILLFILGFAFPLFRYLDDLIDLAKGGIFKTGKNTSPGSSQNMRNNRRPDDHNARFFKIEHSLKQSFGCILRHKRGTAHAKRSRQ